MYKSDAKIVSQLEEVISTRLEFRNEFILQI